MNVRLKYHLPDFAAVPPREDLQDRAIRRFHMRRIRRGVQRRFPPFMLRSFVHCGSSTILPNRIMFTT